ncbi:type II toxin-antitoxin system RelE/ParE family toxin [Paraburkholderia sp.]|uniref:type II toxin-antitoxin system RelE/ParE family toxin n=1 Tax=Paraburkholderia sp. TaxID=1926495 RepID=UPI002626F3E8|nr:type II toxin-antitoxin system RelE/ParE family toxin [Paraburkholderia sp.]
MSVKVVPTRKAMSDLGVVADHIKKCNDSPTARKIISALLDEAERKKTTSIGWAKSLKDMTPSAREVHRWVCLARRYELHYEVLPPHAEELTTIAVLRVWDTRQDR